MTSAPLVCFNFPDPIRLWQATSAGDKSKAPAQSGAFAFLPHRLRGVFSEWNRGGEMQHKVEAATTASYSASAIGATLGVWISENWLALLSAVFLVLTYLTQVYFTWRRDRREQGADQRAQERHLKQIKRIAEKGLEEGDVE